MDTHQLPEVSRKNRPEDVVFVAATTASCDGNNAIGLGHPKVYFKVKDDEPVKCPYCGRAFHLKQDKPA